jgi:hypothetical protein
MILGPKKNFGKRQKYQKTPKTPKNPEIAVFRLFSSFVLLNHIMMKIHIINKLVNLHRMTISEMSPCFPWTPL